MIQDIGTVASRVNARKSDAFDIFNFKHYVGPNPYLHTGAQVFDFTLNNGDRSLPMGEYVEAIALRFPEVSEVKYESSAHLFARTVSEAARLDMGLHLTQYSVKPEDKYTRIALQSLHPRTSRAVVFFVWDWLEAITKNRYFAFEANMRDIQNIFRNSVYGGPTNYALLRTAYQKGIPSYYLQDEGLTQYGYGKKQVRGVATTFVRDSHLDSEFTTRKDDCKQFLNTLGFPVPKGDIVFSLNEACEVANQIHYPVAVKPVSGHKGIGVTADVRDESELESAYDRAVEAIPRDDLVRIIVEKSILGSDFRLLCVDGKFVAAVERRPASVVGDGYYTIDELIERENRKSERLDTPTSPMTQIQRDAAMEQYLEAQGLSLDSVLERDRTIYLRKVANLSAGGVSIDATRSIHHDNIVLAEDIAQYFRLTCLGIDIISGNISESWKKGEFAIIEINAAPGILMHLNPAVGESVDVPASILETFFKSGKDSLIPIITFNYLKVGELQHIINHILLQYPDWTIGGVCHDAVLINQSEKVSSHEYNINIQNMLRNPKLDLLIVEYTADVIETEGMFYQESQMVILDRPNETEMTLSRQICENSTVLVNKGTNICLNRQGLIEEKTIAENESVIDIYLQEIDSVLSTIVGASS